MIQTTSMLSKIDPAEERRMALAKVYRLLIRLAEESQNETMSAEVADTTQEKIGEPDSLRTD